MIWRFVSIIVLFNSIFVLGQNFQKISPDLGANSYFGSGYAGGGISVVDINRDGFLDLSFGTEQGRRVQIYLNDGLNNYVLQNFGINDLAHQKQILWVDIDNDSDLDLYIAAYFSPNKLYLNDGNFNFTDISSTCGIDQSLDDTYGTVFGDVDNDGYLDVYISNHFNFNSRLYKNNGDNTFTDLTIQSGISLASSLNFCAAFFDFDKDGDLDLYKINDKTYQNEMYRNDGNFSFVDISNPSNTDIQIDAMGACIADMNNNGLLDIYIPNSDRLPSTGNLYPGNILLKNNHPLPFQNLSQTSGTNTQRWCWGGSWSDFNNDGYQDLYVSNSGTNTVDTRNVLYFNNGDETFYTQAPADMPGDNKESYSCAVGDLNNDGKVDIIVGTTGTDLFELYENVIPSTNNYIKIELIGTTSNKNGIGSWIEVYAGTDIYTRFTHCGIGYLSQEDYKSHIGIGSHSVVDSINVIWPSGIIDQILEPPINECYTLTEGTMQVDTSSMNIDTTVITDSTYSVARNWMELLLESIRNDYARPTIHARNLYHSSVLMYDMWAVYQTVSNPFFLGNTIDGYTCDFFGIPTSTNVQQDREKAISYGMYRLLRHRFQNSPAAATMFPQYDQYMNALGYDINNNQTDYQAGDAAELGNYIAAEMIQYGLQDGSNEINDYANEYYSPVNDSLVMDFAGNPNLNDFNRWQPLTLDVFIDQAGNEIPINTPDFLSPEWGNVSPFSFTSEDLTTYERNGNTYAVYCDPGSPPLIDIQNGGDDTDAYKWGFSLVSAWSSHLDINDNTLWDISPASIGNIQSYPDTQAEMEAFYDFENGGDSSTGHAINPITGTSYTPQIVKRADYARVLAEFWADGPDSETPPGHWFTILNYVSDNPSLEKRYEGQGPVLDDLEWDVKAYFTLGGTLHDAAIAAWGAKGWYDYIRPVSAIRGLAELGDGGLPLIPGLIELVNAGDPLAGFLNENVGKIKLYAWKGHNYIDDLTPEAGVGWILAENWWPYQRPTFVTPNFAGYVSGHSTFSRAAAEVLTGLTGNPYFPGGMGEFEAPQNEFLVFEQGPSQDITLQWATYRDASDQCSLSRIWGGIHPPADDIPGRLMGIKIGVNAYNYAKSYIAPMSCSETISLNGGWNMISTSCLPANGSMEDVFAPIVNNVIQVKDLTGKTYIPAFNGFNTMNEWDVRLGYLVKLNQPTNLTINGGHSVNLAIDHIPLNPGWNMIACWLQQDTDPKIVFNPILNQVIQVKNLTGSYIPSFNDFNNMGDMTKANGYLVKVNADCILRYK